MYLVHLARPNSEDGVKVEYTHVFLYICMCIVNNAEIFRLTSLGCLCNTWVVRIYRYIYDVCI